MACLLTILIDKYLQVPTRSMPLSQSWVGESLFTRVSQNNDPLKTAVFSLIVIIKKERERDYSFFMGSMSIFLLYSSPRELHPSIKNV